MNESVIKRKIKEESEDREDFCGNKRIDWSSNFKILKHEREEKMRENGVKLWEKTENVSGKSNKKSRRCVKWKWKGS